jgi:hypothetical protein
VIIGVTADGTKEWVAISDGLRESTESWLDVLRDLKDRGLEVGPRLAVGDGALGFWKALDQVYPDAAHQRCWFHKLGNVLTDLPKSLHGKAKSNLQAIWMAATRQDASDAFKRFLKRYAAKYPKATEKLAKGREALALLLRLPGRSLGAPAHHQPHRVHLRHGAPSHQPDQELRDTFHLPRPGLQTGRGGRQDLATHPCPREGGRVARWGTLRRRHSGA